MRQASDFSWHTIPRSFTFSVGDQVWIRPRQCSGRVLECLEHHWRIQPTAADGDNDDGRIAIITLRRRYLVPLFSPQQPCILVTNETSVYRLLAETPCNKDGGVLEIGCSTGKTSVLLWETHASWLGWDTGSGMVKTVQALLSAAEGKGERETDSGDGDTGSRFCVAKMDVLGEPQTAEQMLMQHFGRDCSELHRVFIDIGGNRTGEDVVRVLRWVMQHSAGSLKQIVVKSKDMFKTLATLEDQDAAKWFEGQTESLASQGRPTHPLKAELRYVEGTQQAICRYHNYHTAGCKKMRSGECPFDHLHCHWCGRRGHIAQECLVFGG